VQKISDETLVVDFSDGFISARSDATGVGALLGLFRWTRKPSKAIRIGSTPHQYIEVLGARTSTFSQQIGQSLGVFNL